MLNKTQDLTDFGHAQFDKMMKFSSVLLSSAERLANLQLELSRKALSDHAETFKALSESKDQTTLSNIHGAIIQPSIDKVFSAARQLCEVTMSTQNEINQLIDEQLTDLNKSTLESLDQMSKNAPSGSEGIIVAVKQFVNSANDAFSSATAIARKASAQFAETNVKAAAKAATSATGNSQQASVKK